jgi:hypothetical protein
MRQLATILSTIAILLSSNGCKPSRSDLSEEMKTSLNEESSQIPLSEESTKYFINLMSNFNDGQPTWTKSDIPGKELMGALFVNRTHKQEGFLVIQPSWTMTGTFIPTMNDEMIQKFKKFFKMVLNQSDALPLGHTQVRCEKLVLVGQRCTVAFQTLKSK